jgi:hypothetical protein
MLKELPLLCFQGLTSCLPDLIEFLGEPQDCLDSFNCWLLSVVKDTNNIYSFSTKNETIEVLIAFHLRTGSLSSLLNVIGILLSDSGIFLGWQLYMQVGLILHVQKTKKRGRNMRWYIHPFAWYSICGNLQSGQ